MVATGVEVTIADAERILGADHEVIAVCGHQLAHDRLRRAVGVLVRRIDEGTAGFGEDLELPGALLAGRPPAPVGAEGHGAKGQFANPEPRVA